MNKHRVFIAINLPEKLRKFLIDYQNQWKNLPVRWVNPNSIHLTLVFLGYLSDEEIGKVCQNIKEVGPKHYPFSISFTNIGYNSIQKEIPRLIWVTGEKSEELIFLKNDVEKSLSESIGFSPDNRGFIPHITLGRVKKWSWMKIEPDERPNVSQDISLNFEVKSFEVMESELKRMGPKYTILESVTLEKL